MPVYRSVCPCNCYDACAMLTYVEGGKIVKIEGDPQHGFTRGRLCAKGYAYLRRVYSPERLRYPLRQYPRGSGNWQRLSWDEALEIIAEQMLTIKERYGSTLPLCLNKYSGNFGWLHNAVEAFFDSLGGTTRAGGSPCWSAGLDAFLLDFGTVHSPDPEKMAQSKCLILWGTNPAWTSVHSLSFLQEARRQGAKIIVIDPVFTPTARWADLYLQVKPGSDGALALGAAAYIYQHSLYDRHYVEHYTAGWEDFSRQLAALTLDWAAGETGLLPEAIATLAEIYATTRPAAIWIGFGLQRHTNGGQNVRAINALAAITGHLDEEGGGVYYAHQHTWPQGFQVEPPKDSRTPNRYLNINNFAAEILASSDPPVKFLWVSCRNPVSQEAGAGRVSEALNTLDMIVTVDHFLTPTAQLSDIVLPACTLFEEWDIVSSYWHYWVSVNEPAIPPWFEAKSDLEIVSALAAKLNELAPGSSTFPTDKGPTDWLDSLFDERMQNLLGIESWQELLKGPRKARVEAAFPRKINLVSPVYVPPLSPPLRYPLRLLSPHQQYGLNSQFQNLDWLLAINPEPFLLIHPVTAEKRHLQEGDLARIFNDQGEVVARVKIDPGVPQDVVVAYEAWYGKGNYNVNKLTSPLPTDLGSLTTGFPGCAFYDCFVEVARL